MLASARRKSIAFAAATLTSALLACTEALPVVGSDAGPVEAGVTDVGQPDTSSPATVCTVTEPDSFTPTWKPPTGYPRAACSLADIATIVDACYGAAASPSACEAAKAARAACAACLITDDTVAAPGPIVHYGAFHFDDVNLGGCAALLTGDDSPTSCGAAGAAANDCLLASCAANCPVVGERLDALRQCESDATSMSLAVCRPRVGLYVSICSQEVLAVCSAQHNSSLEPIEATFKRVGAVFCGPASRDGGANGDAASDAPGGG